MRVVLVIALATWFLFPVRLRSYVVVDQNAPMCLCERGILWMCLEGVVHLLELDATLCWRSQALRVANSIPKQISSALLKSGVCVCVCLCLCVVTATGTECIMRGLIPVSPRKSQTWGHRSQLTSWHGGLLRTTNANQLTMNSSVHRLICRLTRGHVASWTGSVLSAKHQPYLD